MTDPTQLATQVNVLLKDGETSSARRLVEQFLIDHPENPLAHYSHGRLLSALYLNNEAREAYDRAVAADPGNAAYMTLLGHALLNCGDFERAEEVLKRAIDLDPQNPAAWQYLSATTKSRPGDAAFQKLTAVAATALASDETRAKYAFALAKWLDDAGEYDRAFEQFESANDLRRRHFDADGTAKFIDSVKRVWTAEFAAERKSVGFESRLPIFIVGMPRSGSTLLEQKLAEHPAVASLGERPEIVRISRSITRAHPSRLLYPLWAADLPPQAFAEFGKFYADKIAPEFPDASRLIDKYLVNFAYIGLICAMLPNALVIESRRNPIDTCLACYFADLKPAHDYAGDLKSLGRMFRLYDELMRHWRDIGLNVMQVRYEEFIEAPERHKHELYKAANLDAAPENADADPMVVRTMSAWQSRQPIYKTSAGRWKNYQKHLGPLIEALGDLA
jgi:tetratricopeptide (TPR) repeat protein